MLLPYNKGLNSRVAGQVRMRPAGRENHKKKKREKQTLKPGEDRHYKSKANAQNYINFADNLLLKNTVDSHYIDIM